MKSAPLLALLLGLIVSAHSETYYLLSKERIKAMSSPLPFNPCMPDIKVHRVMDDIWLLEDEPGDAKGEMSVGDVGLRIALRIQIARESAAILAKANVVFPPPPPRPEYVRPKFYYSGMYWNRDIVKETKPNNGPWIRSMELTHPGFSTNFSKEQLADPVDFPRLPTNIIILHPFGDSTNVDGFSDPKMIQQLPPHIIHSSPTFKEDLEQWKRENGIGSPKPSTNTPATAK